MTHKATESRGVQLYKADKNGLVLLWVGEPSSLPALTANTPWEDFGLTSFLILVLEHDEYNHAMSFLFIIFILKS